MNKLEFLDKLQCGLSGLTQKDIEERLQFYSEMIDDCMEDGLSEEEAVNNIGNIEDIVNQIISEVPLTRLAKEKLKQNKKLEVWEIILLVIGSPLWVSLLVAVLAVLFALFASVLSVIVSIWAVFVAILASSVGIVIGGVITAFSENTLIGFLMIGGGLVCAGISVLLFLGCKSVTKAFLRLIKKAGICLKKAFIKRRMHNEQEY